VPRWNAADLLVLGSLVRIGPNDLITSDPEILKTMGAPRSPYRRSDWYKALRVDRENILSERDEDRHAKLRNKMAAGVSCAHELYHPISNPMLNLLPVRGQRKSHSRARYRQHHRPADRPDRTEIHLDPIPF
jgi:hypothetical protein